MVETRTARDQERESWEQRRYALLEQLYLLTGEDCERAVSPEEVETELGRVPVVPMTLVDDLVRLGYAQYAGTGGEICITEKGVNYVQRGAWRRRSIRD